MRDRQAVALAAKREAYAMCSGCPLTPGQVSAFVEAWIQSELLWVDRPEPERPLRLTRAQVIAKQAAEIEAYIAAHQHWPEAIKQEWRSRVAAGDSFDLIRNRHLARTCPEMSTPTEAA